MPEANLVLPRMQAAMLGLALGDALGATVEFMTPGEIRKEHGIHREIVGGGWLHLKPGQVTDDTGMALALADAILAQNGRVEALACAQAFDTWMRSKPVDIGNTVRRGISQFRLKGCTAMPPSDEAAGNGALMRFLPIALVTWGLDIDSCMLAWRAQAHVTHNNALSDESGELFLRLIHAAFSGASKRTLLNEIAHPFAKVHPHYVFRPKRRDYPSGFVVETVQAVLQAFFDTDTFEECLIDVVNRGGDADTTGAIAGMLAGAFYSLPALPRRWQNQLDIQIRQTCLHKAQTLAEIAGHALPANAARPTNAPQPQ